MRALALWVIRGYQAVLSPLLPPACRYYPSCSEYAYQAIERHGVLRGGLKAGWRLLRCNPWSDGGFDPVDAADRERHEARIAALEAHEQRAAARTHVTRP
ncbi:MAG: membrane protein insertion efficiency factor YidD [Chloroflexi bacterium]|nr:membrane protein insertion efficiency factor YidD [Chloroflexota bacterium]